ncbi:hypothetical protein ACGFNV_46025 [Streptomyces sp. NPDC048751]|uniref:hypothetical protein n=1 Tax=Streptomyces sp. NPDC048751 TaxID=3365591 RepID=UPI003723AA83
MHEEFGESHEGIAGAVLADGSEPKPVCLDFGSGGAGGLETSEWWVYDGTMNRPQAAGYRAACACGWRGPTHPIDWEQLTGDQLDDLDTDAAHRDWTSHTRDVEERAVPVPEDVAALIHQVEGRLSALADQAPLAALRATAALERLTTRIGQEAAGAAHADELSEETIGTALGLSPDTARSLLIRYLLR